MKFLYSLRHPVLAFNRKFVCSYWGCDTRGGQYTADAHNVVTIDPDPRCTRCREHV